MTPIILTGTLTSRLDGTVTDLVLALPVDALQVLAVSFGFLLVLLVFLMSQRFQTWALSLALVLVVFYSPVALTFYGPYFVFVSGIVLILASIAKSVFKIVRA